MNGRERLRQAVGAHVAEGWLVGEAAGRFGLSAGLTGNVVCTPLAESTAVGVGVGLALAGKRVVVELLDAGGLARAADELRDCAVTVRASEGSFRVALVVLTPVGPRIDGVDTIVAGTAAELPGALTSALDAGRPVVLQLSESALQGTEAAEAAAPVGAAVVRRAGEQITLLAEGDGVALALAQPIGEVLDLRGGVDRAAIAASVRKTGRVLLVGHGHSPALDVALHEAFLHLESPPAALHASAGADALNQAVNDSISY